MARRARAGGSGLLLRLFGFVAIVVASTLAGNLVAGSFSSRVKELGQLRTGLHLLGTEVKYAMSALPEAFTRVAQGVSLPVRRIFTEAAARLASGEGLTAGEAWEAAVRSVAWVTALDSGDVEVLLALAPYLGVTDREDQERHLLLVEDRLEAREAEAARDRAASERMWRYLGILGGLALGVALL